VIPIRDINPTRSRPWVVWTLIALNVLVFAWQFLLDQTPVLGQQFVETWGIVPYWLTRGEPGSWPTLVTHMFMHGGLLHIAGNMWFLHVFGDNVEDDMGPLRFLAFYLLCGLAAAGAQIAIDPGSFVPMVGASGAIAGVLAAYVTLYPRARVLTLIPLLVVFFFRELPAFIFILVWFGYQLLMGFSSFGQMTAQSGGVAFFAHIGGFLAGLVLVHVFRRRSKRQPAEGFRPPPVRPYPPGWRPREYD
jgi:membrane associated rhomboid family serine protease